VVYFPKCDKALRVADEKKKENRKKELTRVKYKAVDFMYVERPNNG